MHSSKETNIFLVRGVAGVWPYCMSRPRNEAVKARTAIAKSAIRITRRVQIIFAVFENLGLCHKRGIANGPTMSSITIT